MIAGDVRPAEALAQAKAAFGDIPSRDLPPHAAIEPQPVQPKTLTLETNFSVGLIALAYRMPGLKQSDFAAADVLSDALRSERGALYALVPTGKALMANFDYQAKPDIGFGLAMAGFPAGDDPAPLLAATRGILAEIARDGIPPDLVADAKRQELAQLAFQGNSIRGLARRWSHALAFEGAGSPDDIAHAYETVSVEDVNRLARQLLDPDHAVTAILTPRAAGKKVAGIRLRRRGNLRFPARPPRDAANLGCRCIGDAACARPGHSARRQRAAQWITADRPARACQPHRFSLRSRAPGAGDAGAAGQGGHRLADARICLSMAPTLHGPDCLSGGS